MLKEDEATHETVLEALLKHLENENENENSINWRNDFNIYITNARKGYLDLIKDAKFILKLENSYPNIDVLKSIENSFTLYWATDEGWEKKKGSKKTKIINWKSTITSSIKINAVYKPREQQQTAPQVYEKSKTYEYL
jgi:hypothetical protein